MRSITPIVLLSIAAVVGCGSGNLSAPPGERVAAYLNGEAIFLEEVERYFRSNLLADEHNEELPEGEADEVKSRLLDVFLEERMLLFVAAERQVVVDDRELSAYLGDMVETETDSSDLGDRRLEARRRLMIEKLQEMVVREQQPITDEEVAIWLDRHGADESPRRVRLRSLMFDSIDEAKRIHRDISRKRLSFDEAVVRHEGGPGQGVPLTVGWDDLLPEVRSSIEKLKAGRVSAPLDVNGDVFLFQVESWLEEPEATDEERYRRARAELERLRRQEAYGTLLDGVRRSTEVRVLSGNLSFRYVPEQLERGSVPTARLQ